jgi:hypothetical protein
VDIHIGIATLSQQVRIADAVNQLLGDITLAVQPKVVSRLSQAQGETSE